MLNIVYLYLYHLSSSFVRSGKVNGYKDELTTEQIERADRLIEQRLQNNKVTLEELLLLDHLR